MWPSVICGLSFYWFSPCCEGFFGSLVFLPRRKPASPKSNSTRIEDPAVLKPAKAGVTSSLNVVNLIIISFKEVLLFLWKV